MRLNRGFMPAVVMAVVLALSAAAGRAEDAWFDVPLDHLTLTAGQLPMPTTNPSTQADDSSRQAYVVLDGAGEAFAEFGSSALPTGGGGAIDHLVIHTPDHADVAGRLFVSNGDQPGMTVLHFKVAAGAAKADARQAFYELMRDHYERLLGEGIAGAAYFRHRVREATAALGDAQQGNAQFQNTRPATLDDTFTFFSGDQALSENLQLDRALPPAADKPGSDTVAIRSLTGIAAAKIDWSALIKDVRIRPDPLAKDIPADQAAVFFPDFNSLLAVIDEADRDGTPALQYAQPRSQDAGCRQWYEHQLGVQLGQMARLLGKRAVGSVAITCGDPYLRAGTDVAILIQPTDPHAVQMALSLQMRLLRMQHDVKDASGQVNHLVYSAAISPDRSVSSYRATLKDGTIVITNSLAQLSAIDAVDESGAPGVADQPEYTFFRNRYKLGDPDESALLVITDAAIRRWCGPRERIADSRRVRAAGVLAEFNARYLDALVAGNAPASLIASDFSVPGLNDIRLTPRGSASTTYGSLDFLTPIDELKFDTCTQDEAQAYERWRVSYETNWRTYFDPVALRLGIHDHKLSADLTVRPLIARSDYATAVSITTGAKLNPDSRDVHPDLLEGGFAINVNSDPMRAAAMFISGAMSGMKADPFAWVGSSIWLYADDDPFWSEASAAKDTDAFMDKNLDRLPIGLRIEVIDGLRLAAFLVAAHAVVDQSAPGMTKWDHLTYRDQPYVRISQTDQAKAQDQRVQNVALFYRANGSSLLITLSEPLLKHAIDRDIDRAAAKQAGKPSPDPAAAPLLGDNMIFRADGKLYDSYTGMLGTRFQTVMQQRSWGNLPILNELHRQYPKEDPVSLYAEFFHATLIDPANGQYTWNEQWQTMQSSVYGCPADPKTGPPGISALTGLLGGNFGLTFENNGLRAKISVDRK